MRLVPSIVTPSQMMSTVDDLCRRFRRPGNDFDSFSSACKFVLNRLAASVSRPSSEEYSKAFDQWQVLRAIIRQRKIGVAYAASAVFDCEVVPSSRQLFIQIAMPTHGTWLSPIPDVGDRYCSRCRVYRPMVEDGLCLICKVESHRERCGCDRWKFIEDEIARREKQWIEHNC